MGQKKHKKTKYKKLFLVGKWPAFLTFFYIGPAGPGIKEKLK